MAIPFEESVAALQGGSLNIIARDPEVDPASMTGVTERHLEMEVSRLGVGSVHVGLTAEQAEQLIAALQQGVAAMTP